MNKKNVTMHPAGPAFEELTLEEMIASQGGGDIRPETTVSCIAATIDVSVCVTTIVYSYASGKCN